MVRNVGLGLLSLPWALLLLARIVYTAGHSFIIGRDGLLQAVGYDVNGVYKSLSVGGNVDFRGAHNANISFEKDNSSLLISGNSSNSFTIGSAENPRLFHIDTTFNKEFVNINGSLSVAGDIDASHSPTTLIVRDQDERALEVTIKGVGGGTSRSEGPILSLNTSGSVSRLSVDGSILSRMGVQSLAQFFHATKSGISVPSHSSVAHITSDGPGCFVVLPFNASVGHYVRFINNKGEFRIALKTGAYSANGTINGRRTDFLNVSDDKAMVDCTLVTPRNDWVCVFTDIFGRQEPSDVLRISDGLRFSSSGGVHHSHLKLQSSPSSDRLLLLPDVSGTVITTGNLHDLKGEVDSMIVTGEFEVRGDVVFGGSERNKIVLGGTIQNWNVPIVAGVSSRFSLLTVSVFNHGFVRGTKIVLYNIRSGLDMNHAYEVDRPTRNSVTLKYFDGVQYVPSINYTSPLSSDSYVLPMETIGHRVEGIKFVDSLTIHLNVTMPTNEANDLSWGVIIENNDVKWGGPFNITDSKRLNTSSSNATVQLVLKRPTSYPRQVEAFGAALYPSISLRFHKAKRTDLKTIAFGVSNTTKAMVATELPHFLDQNETIEISGTVLGMNLPHTARTFAVELISPYEFYLLNKSTFGYIDTSSFATPGYGGYIFTKKTLQFKGRGSENVRTALLVDPPSANRTIHLPDADGTILTTGNLYDVTSRSGSFSSLRVEGPLVVNGSTTFGNSTSTDISKWYGTVRSKGHVILGDTLRDALKIESTLVARENPIESIQKGEQTVVGTGYPHALDANDIIFVAGSNESSTENNRLYRVGTCKSKSFVLPTLNTKDVASSPLAGGVFSKLIPTEVQQIPDHQNALFQNCSTGTCKNVVATVADGRAFAEGDVVIIIGNNQSVLYTHHDRMIERKPYGHTVCGASEKTISLCDTARTNYNPVAASWSGGFMLRVGRAAARNVTFPSAKKACSSAPHGLGADDVIVFGNTPNPSNASFVVLSAAVKCVTFNDAIDFQHGNATGIYMTKIATVKSQYQSMYQSNGSLIFDTGVNGNRVESSDVIVAFDHQYHADIYTNVFMVKERLGAGKFSIYDTKLNNFSNRASTGYIARISYAAPPPGTVLTFGSGGSASHLTIPETIQNVIVSIPSVSGTVLTTENLKDVDTSLLSTSLMGDIVATGKVI